MWLLDRLLSRLIRKGAFEVRYANGTLRRYGDGEGSLVRVALADSRVARQLARNPALYAGEAYMDGRLRLEEGDIGALIDVVAGNARFDRGNEMRRHLWAQQQLLAKWEELNDRRRARQHVHHHYDLGDSLYDLFLGEERQYSCAYFRPENRGEAADLDRAQRDKLAIIGRKLCLKPGQKVLDIGCGWGGMAFHLNRQYGADVLGITLSDNQLAYARAKAERLGVADKVRFELRDYRDVQGRFDRIVSVGMFEHVGRPNYFSFFDTVGRLLADDGVALIHFIGRAGGRGTTDPWTAKYIFPGGYTPALSEVMPHVEHAFLWATDIEVWRLHYAWTLAQWLKRCRERKEAILALYDEQFFRMWEFYLCSAMSAFQYNDHAVFQLQLARQRDAVPLTRDYLYSD